MPVIEALGEPRKIAFVITEKGIQLEKADDEETTTRHLCGLEHPVARKLQGSSGEI